jgi:hypothetical protein
MFLGVSNIRQGNPYSFSADYEISCLLSLYLPQLGQGVPNR